MLLCVYTRYNPFAHSSCTSLLILFIKSTVYCPAHFILLCFFIFYLYLCISLVLCYIFCTVYWADLTYIWLLIIFCIIEYVTNKTLNPNTRALYLHLHNQTSHSYQRDSCHCPFRGSCHGCLKLFLNAICLDHGWFSTCHRPKTILTQGSNAKNRLSRCQRFLLYQPQRMLSLVPQYTSSKSEIMINTWN